MLMGIEVTKVRKSAIMKRTKNILVWRRWVLGCNGPQVICCKSSWFHIAIRFAIKRTRFQYVRRSLYVTFSASQSASCLSTLALGYSLYLQMRAAVNPSCQPPKELEGCSLHGNRQSECVNMLIIARRFAPTMENVRTTTHYYPRLER